MAALEVITGYVTAPSTTETILTMASGNSATIRASSPNAGIYLIDTWAKSQTAGIWKIRSPRSHDNVQGLRFRTTVAEPRSLFHYAMSYKLYAQDTLLLSLSGSATSGDIEQASCQIYYEDLPGANGRFITPEAMNARLCNTMSCEVAITGGSAGGYSGAVLLNSSFDLMKGNTDYALLGYDINLVGCTLRIYGQDTGNLGIGMPATAKTKETTSTYFIDLSKQLGRGLIPVINSSNKSNTYVDIACDENGGAYVANLIFAELTQ